MYYLSIPCQKSAISEIPPKSQISPKESVFLVKKRLQKVFKTALKALHSLCVVISQTFHHSPHPTLHLPYSTTLFKEASFITNGISFAKFVPH